MVLISLSPSFLLFIPFPFPHLAFPSFCLFLSSLLISHQASKNQRDCKCLEFAHCFPTSSDTTEITLTSPGRASSSKDCPSALHQFSLSLGEGKRNSMLFSIFEIGREKLTETARTHDESGNSRRLDPIISSAPQ